MPHPAARPRLEPLEDRTTPSAGQLDPTFHTTGRQIVPFSPPANTYDNAYAVAVAADGGVVLGGTTATASQANSTAAAVVKLTSAGDPDPTFGSAGRVTFSFLPGDPTAVSKVVAVAALPDGKVLVGGTVSRSVSQFGVNYDFAAARLTADGQLDPTFGVNGRAVVAFDLFAFGDGSNEDIARGMAVDAQGRILLAGNVSESDMQFRMFGVARLTASGQLDTTFDGDGRAVVTLPASFAEGVAEGVAVGPDGRVVLAGWARPWSDLKYDYAAVALTPSGQLDTSFDGDGVWVYGLNVGGNLRDQLYAVRVDSAGRVVLAGDSDVAAANTDAVVLRLLPSGQLDSGFNGTGVVRLGFDRGGGNFDSARAVALDQNGRVVVAGTTQTADAPGGQTAEDFFVTRLLPGGGADPGYGAGGTAVVDFTPESGDPLEFASAVTLDSSGRAVVAGSAFRGLTTGLYDFAVARLTTDAVTNHPPTPYPDTLTVNEGAAAAAVDVLANDSSAPDAGETLSVTAVTQPAHGAVTLAGGVVRYAPAAGFHGADWFTYTLSDGNGGSATGTVFVAVAVAGGIPAPAVTFAATGFDTPGNAMAVAAGDFNGDGKADAAVGSGGGLTTFRGDGAGGLASPVTAGTGSSFPHVVRVADLTGDGKPDVIVGNDSGQSLSVFVGNGDGTFGAPVVVPVGGANLQGVAVADFDRDGKLDVVVSLDDRLAVLRNVGGAGILGAPTFFGAGTGGTSADAADLNGDGNPDAVAADMTHDRLVVFFGTGTGAFGPAVPLSTGTGSQPYGVIAADWRGGPLDLNGDGKPDLAAALNGTGAVGVLLGDGAGRFTAPLLSATGSPRAGRLTAADLDADGLLDLAVTVSGGLSPSPQAILTGDGTGRFAAADAATIGMSDVTAADLNGDGRPDLLGTLPFSPGAVVAALNTTPVVASFQVSAPAAVTTGVPFTVTVTAKDAVGATFTGYRGSVHFTSSDAGAVLPADLRFDPADGGVKTFAVTLTATGAQTVGVADRVRTGATGAAGTTVFRVNHAPAAADDTLALDEDTSAAAGVLGNDSAAPDAGETLTVTAVTQPTHGAVTLVAGVVTYTPAANYNGPDSFTYTISDGFAGPGGPGTATATVRVTVRPVNDPPTANADALTVAEDGGATAVAVLANDSAAPDTGETLTVTGMTQPAHGTVALVGGVVRYAPAADYFGADSFTYTISDGNGGTATAAVSVTVTSRNDAPSFVKGADQVVNEDSGPRTVTGWATGITAGPANEAGQALTFLVTTTNPGLFAAAPAVSPTGVLTFTPAPDANGTAFVTVTLTDDGGTANGGADTSAAQTFAVTVVPVADPPVAVADGLTVAEDAPATVVDVLANDAAGPDGGTLAVTAVTQPAHGTVTRTGGVVRYAPAADFNGTDAFSYTMTGGNGLTATAVVTVTVTPVNDPPTAADDSFSVTARSATLAVLGNDTTAPDAGETLTVTAVTQPAAGGTAAVAPGGAGVVFTPAVGFSGPATFTYTVSDGNGGTDTATVTVTVVPAVGPVRPVAVGGAADGTVRLTGPGGTTTVAPFGPLLAVPVRTATADVDGDGTADVVAVTGPGTPLRVAVLSGATGRVLLQAFDPFGGDFAGGGFVAAGDLDGDGRAEFAVTPDQGGGPRVTVFGLDAKGFRQQRANFFGIDDPNFRGGARAALGDVNRDGVPDVVVAAGFGGGPRAAIFTGQSVLAGAPARLVNDFFAFPGSDATNLRNGAFVAAGDVDGDGYADLVFGGGPGGAPRVFILSGAAVTAGDVAGAQASPVANFFVAGDSADRGGARVAVTNTDGDGRADVAVGSGAGDPARVRVYLGKDFTGGGEPASFSDFSPLGGAALADGVYVG